MTDKKLTVENFKKAEEKERRLLEDYGYKALSIERLRHREMMADKEQIMIDGVDVSECSALCCGNTCFLSQHYSFTEPKHKSFCADNPLCDHKQLARKTQECELLETQLESYHIGEPKLTQRNQELEQECEELKKQLSETKTFDLFSEKIIEKLNADQIMASIFQHYSRTARLLRRLRNFV